MQKIQYKLSREEYIDEIASNIYMRNSYKKKLKSIETKAIKIYFIVALPLNFIIWIIEIFLLKNIGEVIAELEALILIIMLGLGVLRLLVKRAVEERYKNKLRKLIEKGISRELLIYKNKIIINYCDYDVVVRNNIFKKVLNEIILKDIKFKKSIDTVELVSKDKFKIIIPINKI